MGRTMGQIKKEKGIGGPPLLKGSDLPKGITKLKIKIAELREGGKDFQSPAIIDLEKPVYEKGAWALNITNLRALARVCGHDDEEFENLDFDDLAKEAKGKSLNVGVAMVNNPKTKKMAPGLFIIE